MEKKKERRKEKKEKLYDGPSYSQFPGIVVLYFKDTY